MAEKSSTAAPTAPPHYLIVDMSDDPKWEGAVQRIWVDALRATPPTDEDERYTIVRPFYGDAVPRSAEELRRYRAVVITGSARSALELPQLAWMQPVAEMLKNSSQQTHTRLFGSCFGHQLVAQALGGRVEKVPGDFVIGPERLRPTHELWRRFVSRDAELVLESHGDVVTELPPRSMRLATSDTAELEAYAVRVDDAENAPVAIFCVQSHPELPKFDLQKHILGKVSARMSAPAVKAAEEAIDLFEDDSARRTFCAIKHFLARGWPTVGVKNPA